MQGKCLIKWLTAKQDTIFIPFLSKSSMYNALYSGHQILGLCRNPEYSLIFLIASVLKFVHSNPMRDSTLFVGISVQCLEYVTNWIN